MRDSEGNAGASLGIGNYPNGGGIGSTLEPYNGPSCAGGPGWTHYEIDSGPFLEDNPSGAKIYPVAVHAPRTSILRP